MHILVHDYGGYAFPLDLSKELGRRNYAVTHAYCASLQTTPPGVGASPEGVTMHPLSLGEPLNKYNFIKRWQQERAYGALIKKAVQKIRPDIVISANTPLDAQKQLSHYCASSKTPCIYWLQDLLGVASQRILKNKIPVAGALIGHYYASLERSLLKKSAAVVAITEDFLPILHAAGVKADTITTIPNWAPLDALPERPKRNTWSETKNLGHSFNFLYAGTLGMKHNPDLLLQLAMAMQDEPGTKVVVISQGMGADWLSEQKKVLGVDNLHLEPYQPVEALGDVLGSADVLVALLEPDAGTYSVPSKVMTYLCARRALLLAMPLENRAARIVSDQRGFVVEPGSTEPFIEAAKKLRTNAELRTLLGSNARRYAELHFDIRKIGDAFESVIRSVLP